MRDRPKSHLLVKSLLLTISIGLLNIVEPSPEAIRSYNAATYPDSTCPEIMPTMDHADIIAVFGAGTETEDGVSKPNSYMEYRLKTAAKLFALGYSDKIVILDGGNESSVRMSKKLLREFVNSFSDGKMTINEDQLVFINDSINTAKNVQDLDMFMKNNDYKNAIAVTDLFHEKRGSELTKSYGVDADFASPECMAQEFSPEDLPYFDHRNSLPEMNQIRAKEHFGLIELVIDKKGTLTILRKEFLLYFQDLQSAASERIAQYK